MINDKLQKEMELFEEFMLQNYKDEYNIQPCTYEDMIKRDMAAVAVGFEVPVMHINGSKPIPTEQFDKMAIEMERWLQTPEGMEAKRRCGLLDE